MKDSSLDEIDVEVHNLLKFYGVAVLAGHLAKTPQGVDDAEKNLKEAKSALQTLITKREREAYKKGYIDRGLEELNTSEGGE